MNKTEFLNKLEKLLEEIDPNSEFEYNREFNNFEKALVNSYNFKNNMNYMEKRKNLKYAYRK